MMVQDFLKNAFSRISETFPHSRIEYQYKPSSCTHFIRVTPSEVFNDEAFVDLDLELSKAFFELDTEDDIGIITEDGILDTPKLIYEPAPSFTIEDEDAVDFIDPKSPQEDHVVVAFYTRFNIKGLDDSHTTEVEIEYYREAA